MKPEIATTQVQMAKKGIYPLKGKLKEKSPIITDKMRNTAKRNLQ